MRTGGWTNRSAYPLQISQIADRALVKMQAERNLSRGKALNVALNEGLIALGYLTRQGVEHKHSFVGKTGDDGRKWFECEGCREVYVPA